MKDFYAILGVDKNASEKQIKTQFRKLAKQFHPDRNPDNEESAERFKEVSEAYDVLGDPKKRQEYDLALSGGGFRSYNSFEDLFNSFGFNPFDPFADKINKNLNRNKEVRAKKINLELTIDELFAGGKNSSVRVRVAKDCVPCGGKGGDYVETCHACAGMGTVHSLDQQGPMIVKTSRPCSTCHGRGKLISGLCVSCEGSGKIKIVEKYNIEIKTSKVT